MRRLSAITVLVFLALFCLPGSGRAKVDWRVNRTMNLEAAPLDVAQTADGRYTFVLTDTSRVLIYSWDGQQVDSIKVEPDMDRITVTGGGEVVYLSSREHKKVQEVRVEYQARFDLAGATIMGKPEAPGTIVVFSDYQ